MNTLTKHLAPLFLISALFASNTYATPVAAVKFSQPQTRSVYVSVEGSVGEARQVSDPSNEDGAGQGQNDKFSTTPLSLEVSYRLHRNLRLGAYVGYSTLTSDTVDEAIAEARDKDMTITSDMSMLRYGLSLNGDFALSSRLNLVIGARVGSHKMYQEATAQFDSELASFLDLPTMSMKVSSEVQSIEVGGQVAVLFNVTDHLQIGPRASVSTIEALSGAATIEAMGESKSQEFSKEDMEDVPSPVLWNVGVVAQMSF